MNEQDLISMMIRMKIDAMDDLETKAVPDDDSDDAPDTEGVVNNNNGTPSSLSLLIQYPDS